MTSTPFGSMLLVFSGVFTFLVDAYPVYAASALAANSFARYGMISASGTWVLLTRTDRSSFAAAFPLFGNQSASAPPFDLNTNANPSPQSVPETRFVLSVPPPAPSGPYSGGGNGLTSPWGANQVINGRPRFWRRSRC